MVLQGYGGQSQPVNMGMQMAPGEGYSQYPAAYASPPQQQAPPAPIAALQSFGAGAAAGLGQMRSRIRASADNTELDVQNAFSRVIPNIPTRTRTITTTTTTTITTTGLPCSYIEDDVNYPGNNIREHPNTNVAETCCQLCALEPACLGWSWVKLPGLANSNTCYLKGAMPRPSVTRLPDPSYTSGMPLQVGRQLTLHTGYPGELLYCFSLVVPDTYEPSMIRMQYEKSTSIFECDEMAVYSNVFQELAPGVFTSLVDSTLKCDVGGEFGTALNTPIFLAVWQQVVQAARYQKHDWTVKVDPDTVFFPAKLRYVVAAYQETPMGTYLNNCQRGLHGPLEIFSTNAINNWWFGKDTCKNRFELMCGGDCQWGEDMFIDQCLLKVLGADRRFDQRLLVEEHCDPPPNWQSCRLPDAVAIHPFKTPEAYLACKAVMDSLR